MDERHRAERAIERRVSATLAELQKREWPGAARRIADARLRAGLSDIEVSDRIGLGIHAYWHVEHADDEAFLNLSLDHLAALAEELHVPVAFLLLGPVFETAGGKIGRAQIRTLLQKKIADSQMSPEAFADSIGWDVTDILNDADGLGAYTVEALFTIAGAIGIDWVEALP